MQEVAEETNATTRRSVVAKFFKDNSKLFRHPRYTAELAGAARFEDLPSTLRTLFQHALVDQGYDVIPEGGGYSPQSTPPGSPKGATSQAAYPPSPQPIPATSDTAPSQGAGDVEMDPTSATNTGDPHSTGTGVELSQYPPPPPRFPKRDRKPPSKYWVTQGRVSAPRSRKPKAQAKGPQSS